MANNYVETSFIVPVPADKTEQAEKLVEDFINDPENQSNYYDCFFDYEFNNDGLWIHSEESCNVDAVIDCVQVLLDELDIDEPVAFSWAYTCSKPRVDEFGGGAACLRKGEEPIIIEALQEVMTRAGI